MKKHLFLAAFLLAAMLMPAKAQLLQFGFKVQYSTLSIDEMISDVTNEINDFSTDFLKGCEAGIFLRINVGRWITIQPEANFSVGSIWDSVEAAGNFIDKVVTTFGNVQTVNLSVPVLAAVHLVDIENMLAVRAFLGPEFYTTIKSAGDRDVDLANYSFIAGVGVDLLGFLNIDGRICKSKDAPMFYRLGVGLLF